MPKITSSNTKGIFLRYLIKIVASSVLSVFILTAIMSFIVQKLDLDLKVLDYFAIAICVLSSGIISIVSISGFKNNYLIFSLISVIPLLLFTIINFCVIKSDSVIEIIKIAAIIIVSAIVAIIKSGRKSR